MNIKNRLLRLLIPGLAVITISANCAEHDELKAFPAASDGMQRFVIVLQHKDRQDEKDFRVEIIAGKEMLTDGVNLVRLTGSIEPRSLQGWGYTYYELAGSPKTISTMMAPPAGSPEVSTFVSTSPLQIPYNSRLPVVVYVPNGFDVRFRIWKATEEFRKATKG